MDNPNHLKWDYHLHNLILNGVYVAGEDPYYGDLKDRTLRRFRRFNFKFAGHRYDTFQNVQDKTPYSLIDNRLFYQNEVLADLPFERAAGEDDTWGSEQNWYFKKIVGQPEFYELRLNPVNFCANVKYKTGENHEFRGCAFCHRCYPYARYAENRKIVKPETIFSEIFSRHGPGVVKNIQKVLMITGDTNTAEQLLSLAEAIYYQYLAPHQFKGTFSLATTLIRKEENIRRLSRLDDTLFEFPLECFSRRQEILGERKGIPLPEVAEILSCARKYFKYIRIDYIIGIDDIKSALDGFCFLMENRLIDDIIPNILTPFSPQMLVLRHPEANSIYYLYAFRDLLGNLGLAPKRTGITKNVFPDFAKSITSDELAYRKL